MTKEQKAAYMDELMQEYEAGHYKEVLFLLASNQRDKGDLGSFFDYHVEEYERWFEEE